MKRIIIFIFFLAMMATGAAYAEIYCITAIDADSITINNKVLTEGDKFDYNANSEISWGSATVISAYSTTTGKTRWFYKPQGIDEKQTVLERLYSRTIGAFTNFFVKDNAGSTRTFGDYDLGLYLSNTFVLADTMRVRIDDISVVSLYSETTTQVPEYKLSFVANGEAIIRPIPRINDELIITRPLLADNEGKLSQRMVLTVLKEYNQRQQVITNTLVILIP